MRAPSILILTLAILFAGCSATPENGDPAPVRTTANGNAGPEAAPPANVPDVTGRRIRVEWQNLNPRNGNQHIGLINRTSPELAEMYRNPQAYEGFKPIDDDRMAEIMAGFRREDFYDLAEEGRTAASYSMGDGNGVVSLSDGDRSWALFFPRMTNPDEARSSPIPTTYRDLKMAIIYVYNRTLYLAPSAPRDPNRVFRVPSSDRRR